MTQSIHGHEVIEMIVSSQELYTMASLRTAIVERFGGDARFHTCSAENMDAEQIIAFFARRGKFTGRPEGFTINQEEICQH